MCTLRAPGFRTATKASESELIERVRLCDCAPCACHSRVAVPGAGVGPSPRSGGTATRVTSASIALWGSDSDASGWRCRSQQLSGTGRPASGPTYDRGSVPAVPLSWSNPRGALRLCSWLFGMRSTNSCCLLGTALRLTHSDWRTPEFNECLTTTLPTFQHSASVQRFVFNWHERSTPSTLKSWTAPLTAENETINRREKAEDRKRKCQKIDERNEERRDKQEPDHKQRFGHHRSSGQKPAASSPPAANA